MEGKKLLLLRTIRCGIAGQQRCFAGLQQLERHRARWVAWVLEAEEFTSGVETKLKEQQWCNNGG
jgi:hypothetical protein